MSFSAVKDRETTDRASVVVRQEFDRFIRRVSNGGVIPRDVSTGSYPVDISEDDGAVIVEAELPGFKKNEINITLNHKTVRITANRRAKEVRIVHHLKERRSASFDRSFQLPAVVDEVRADARLTDGILILRIPKADKVSHRAVTLSFSDFDWSR